MKMNEIREFIDGNLLNLFYLLHKTYSQSENVLYKKEFWSCQKCDSF